MSVDEEELKALQVAWALLDDDVGCEYFDINSMPISFYEYLKIHHSEAYKRVAEDHIADVRVSTVWLGLNHNYHRGGPPMIFETMVFGGDNIDLFCDRYSTKAEALAGHREVVRKLANGETLS
mgnify:CR=1 FL=1